MKLGMMHNEGTTIILQLSHLELEKSDTVSKLTHLFMWLRLVSEERIGSSSKS